MRCIGMMQASGRRWLQFAVLAVAVPVGSAGSPLQAMEAREAPVLQALAASIDWLEAHPPDPARDALGNLGLDAWVPFPSIIPRLAPWRSLGGCPGYLSRPHVLGADPGWASESMNPELPQQAEEDRLQQEVQLLREEIRIKDARMEQIEAHTNFGEEDNLSRGCGLNSSVGPC